MIGALDPTQREISIVGGGISGMLLAERFSREGWRVELFESTDRLGGMLGTAETSWGMAERAAHSLLASLPVREHFQRLGLGLESVAPDARARWILTDGHPRKVPLGPWPLMKLLLRAYFVPAPKVADSENWSVGDWARRHLGEDALERLVDPGVTGIFGCRPSELSALTAFPGVHAPPGHSLLSFMLAKHFTRRSKYAHLRRPRDPERRMVVPEGGMRGWVETLSRELHRRPSLTIRYSQELRQLPDSPNIALCVPPRTAASLLEALYPKSAVALAAVRSSPLATVTVFPRITDFVDGPPKGVGMLVPEREKRSILGVLFNSSAFPSRIADSDRVSLTVLMGGTRAPHLLDRSDVELDEMIRGELQALLGFRGGVLDRGPVNRWTQAIPIYGPELARAWRQLWDEYAKHPGRIAFGNWTGQISLRGMIETASGLVI